MENETQALQVVEGPKQRRRAILENQLPPVIYL